MMKKILVLTTFAVLLLWNCVYAEISKGAEEINLAAGKKKSVDFPHKLHQDSLEDCSLCHFLFPMKKGVIQKKRDDGSLKKKSVMRECIGCHKKLTKDGKKAGPTSCRVCHSGK